MRDCRKWKADGRPKQSAEKAVPGNATEPVVALISIGNDALAADADSKKLVD